jgi:electron transport complex protein RnfD
LAENKLQKSLLRSSPHAKGTQSVPKVMWSVVIALAPAALASIWFFGLAALLVYVLAVIGCIGFEYLLIRMRGRGHEAAMRFALDGSAVITGVLLAMNLPASSPWWMVVIGALVAMLLGKHVFGGLGQNVFNPALVARVFLLLAFPAQMTAWTKPSADARFAGLDAETYATPLGMVKADGMDAVMEWMKTEGQDLWAMLIGNTGGSLGETSALLLLVGAIFLFYRGYITWHIPVSYIATVFAITGIFWLVAPGSYLDPVIHVLSAGLFLGAFYMATDMVTTPLSTKGMIIFGVGCGLITAVIRLFGSFPEGVSFAILIMNGLTPLIDRYTRPRTFGAENLKRGEASA